MYINFDKNRADCRAIRKKSVMHRGFQSLKLFLRDCSVYFMNLLAGNTNPTLHMRIFHGNLQN